MILRPLHRHVLLEPRAPMSVTPAGLHVVREELPAQRGRVLAVWPDVRVVSVGDDVLVSWASGQEIKINRGEQTYVLVPEADLLAIVEPGAPSKDATMIR